jgi:hypothetical protein
MSANTDFNPLAQRVAHLHARLEWDADADRLLALMRRMNARGVFTVLVAPAAGLLARRARQAGLRVIDLESSWSGRRRLVPTLFEFHLTHLHAPDPSAASLGQRLRRRLKLPLILPGSDTASLFSSPTEGNPTRSAQPPREVPPG